METNSQKRRGNFIASLFGHVAFRRWLLGFITFMSLFVILAFDLMPSTVDLRIGEVAKRDVEAPRTIVNKPRTESMQEEARKRVLRDAVDSQENYEVDQRVPLRAEETLNNIFALAKAKRDTLNASRVPGQTMDPRLIKQTATELRLQLKRYQSVDLLNRTAQTLISVDTVGLEAMQEGATETLVDLLRQTRIGEQNLNSVKDAAMRQVDGLPVSEASIVAIRDIVSGQIVPNLVLSSTRIRKIEDSAVRSVDPVMILKGQTVVRRGEVVTREQEKLLRDLGLQKRNNNYTGLLGLAVLVLGLITLAVFYLRLYNPNVLAKEEYLALISALLVTIAFLAKLLTSLEYGLMGYVIPVAFASMLVTVLLDPRLGIMFTLIASVIVGVMTDLELKFAVVSMVSGVVGVYSLTQVHQRSDLTRAGFTVGLAGFFMATSLGLLSGDFPLTTLASGGLAALNGILSAILSIGSLPFIEAFFGIASSIKLVELSNPTQILLKRLLVEAPGTYHHSIVVGNLAEAAAEAVGADYLLARVGAHYHDIGKLKRPYFFVENQFASENPHDKISPSLSTVIITSHVADGVNLAEEHKLPSKVTDFIQEHHGTSLVSYFYHRATEAAGNDGVLQEQFRYSGPKPRSRETAIVMLADSVEAAVRSMNQPTPEKMEQLIKKIVKDKLTDGQLDECDLTLRELEVISTVFLKILSGIFHSRVEYPDFTPPQPMGKVTDHKE